MTVEFANNTKTYTLPEPLSAVLRIRVARDLVTIGEWNEYAKAKDLPMVKGNPTLPVVSISWVEAKAYAEWFSLVHNVKARLPYEYELTLLEHYEDIRNQTFDGWPHKSIETAVLPGKYVNDIVGRAYQWCEDGNKFNRVIRGGSWSNYPRNARVANRGRGTPVNRSNYLGLRLAFD